VVILVNGALGDRKLDRRFRLMSGLALCAGGAGIGVDRAAVYEPPFMGRADRAATTGRLPTARGRAARGR
jgi:hypothetical protein